MKISSSAPLSMLKPGKCTASQALTAPARGAKRSGVATATMRFGLIRAPPGGGFERAVLVLDERRPGPGTSQHLREVFQSGVSALRSFRAGSRALAERKLLLEGVQHVVCAGFAQGFVGVLARGHRNRRTAHRVRGLDVEWRVADHVDVRVG